MPLTPGQQIGAYEIVGPIGAGGMGEVYRARDTRLGRDVALKVLPPEVVNEPGRLERFDREARAIAALNHPHIVTIYSTEDVDGIRFLTMELVEGSTLSDLVVSSGMALPRFLEIAMPMAEALAAAHLKQITHRDLKPGNVMVSDDGRVKVLDFGLARVGDAGHGEQAMIATQAPITHQGMIVGTMPYMSPEQVEGRPLDPRTDLFSLGVIFYELLSGARPFTGASSPALMSAILRDSPSSVRDQRPDVPEPLDRLISRLLEKRPEDRVQTARDVFNELRHIKGSGGSTAVQRKASDRTTTGNLSVAVLPFTVRGADADADVLAAGFTDDITTSLAKFSGLSVVAAQSTRAFKDSPLDVRQIAERIGARYMVSGNVRKSGATIRVSAQLIDAQSGTQLWSETYDRRLDNTDLFAVQDDVTDHIVATLADESGVLAQSMARSVQQTSIGEASGEQLVVQMWGFMHDPTAPRHAELRSAFERLVEAQPNNAHAWANLANLYLVEHQLWFNPLPDAVARAMQAARRAIEIDRASQLGWLWLGIAHFHRHDRRGLDEAVDRAIRINPRSANTIAWMGNILTSAGEYERGSKLTERAMQINPGHPGWLHFAVFNRHFAAGEFEEALQAARRVNIPTFFWMHFAIAAACGHLERGADGKAAYDSMIRTAPMLMEAANLREFVTRWYWEDAMVESLLNGVQRSSTGVPNDRPNEPISGRSSVPRSKPPSSTSGSSKGSATSVAVLPFVARSSDEESKAIAEGLTDDISTGLSRFGIIKVLSLSAPPVNARYTLSGQVRKAGTSLRINATLTDTESGLNVWAEQYAHAVSETPFAIQDAVARAIVATIGDYSGVLSRLAAAVLADPSADGLDVAKLIARYVAYSEHYRPEEHARLRDGLERALVREPQSASGWAILSFLYEQEHSQGLNPLPESRVRQRRAADRAVEIDPRSQLAWTALASTHLFARDRDALHGAIDRAIAINPLNADVTAEAAVLLAGAGDYDRAEPLIRTALAQRSEPPGWYYLPLFEVHFARHQHEDALRAIKQVNMPLMANVQFGAASVAGHLGLAAESRPPLNALRAIDPKLLDPARARQGFALWMWDEAFLDHIDEGFRRALSLSGVGAPGEAPSRPSSSSATSKGGDLSIAVLPFADLSEKKDQDWFCDGIAEEILNALALLPGLRVAARASAFSLRGKGDDLRSIGEKLHVTTVLEGSVRRAGNRVRISAQLSDAKEGLQLWSERFDRELEDIFDVQEQIARAIVERLRVTITGAPDRLVPHATANVEAYQLLLKGRVFLNRRGPAIANAVPCFEQAIALDPNLADAHAGLGDTYRLFGVYGLLPTYEALRLARASLERALAIDPEQVEALATLANIMSAFQWDYEEARAVTDRALTRDPSHVRALGESAITIACSKAEPSSAALNGLIRERIRRARALDPLSAWPMAIEAMVLVILGDLQEAVDLARHAVAADPDNFTAHWARVFTLARLDRVAETNTAAEAALAMSRRHPMVLAELATLSARHGDVARAAAMYQELNDRAAIGFVSPAARACAAAAAGQLDAARRLLAQALDERDVFISFYKLPAWRAIWDDAECASMLRASKMMQNRPV